MTKNTTIILKISVSMGDYIFNPAGPIKQTIFWSVWELTKNNFSTTSQISVAC